jgi:hypothetical protein
LDEYKLRASYADLERDNSIHRGTIAYASDIALKDVITAC